MASALVIGIGSTGLAILEEAEQFYYDFAGKNKPGSNTELMFIETDVRRLPKKTALGSSSITQVDFPLGDNAVDIHQLKKNDNIDSSWIPDASNVLKNLSGAGGMPAYGRLSLWGRSNYDKLKSVITDRYQRIGGDGDTIILLVGSLTGGTGSGLMVDVAYLVRDITKNSNVHGLILLPDLGSFGSNKALHENSFSALTAIDKYSKETIYNICWPDNGRTNDMRSPFSLVQYISQDFTGPKASINRLEELIRVAGSLTALHYMDTDVTGNYFYDLISKRRVDSKGNGKIGDAISAGFLMVQFPKGQLEELLSIEIGSGHLKRLIDSNEFEDNFGNRRSLQGEETSIANDMFSFTESVIDSCIEDLESITVSSGESMGSAMQTEAQILNKGSHQQISDARYLFDLFSTRKGGNYYEIIKNNNSLVRDRIINSFSDKIEKVIETYKNLNIAIKGIEKFEESIIKLRDFYKKSHRIEGSESNWDAILKNYVSNAGQEELAFKLLSRKYNRYENQLQELFKLTAIQNIIPVLEQVLEHLGAPANYLTTSENKALPSKKELSKITAEVQRVLAGDGSDGAYTLKRRKNQLRSFMETYSSCFKMVYQYGSLDADLKEAWNNYRKDENKAITYNDLFSNKSIYGYLSAGLDKLYSEVLSNTIVKVRSKQIFDNTSLYDIIKSIKQGTREADSLLALFNSNRLKIKSYIPAMLKLKENEYDFGDDASAKLIILSSDSKQYDELFKEYSIAGGNGDNSCDIPSMKNTIIFYQEYGFLGENTKQHFDVLKHLKYTDDVKDWIDKKLDQKYIKEKVPYLTLEEFKSYLK